MAEDLHQKALNLELKKRYMEAGEVWEAAGQIEKAVVNYHRGGNLKRAIELALKKGLNKRAADLYVKAEIYDKAAELYRKERDFSHAARAYRQGGLIQEAAAMFESAEEFTEAAKVYESVNDFLKAGELYDKGGDLANSARVYELAIDNKALDRLGGRKDLARVAEVLTRVKNFERAAEIYVQAQEVSEAVLLFVRMGEVEGAARLLANCQSDVGFEVLSRLDYNDIAATLEYARMFYLAHDYGKAARIFESCREFERAAFLYEKNQDYHQAAEMFAQAQDMVRAAENFEKAGSFKDAADHYLRAKEGLRAAACYEACEDFFAAGRLYFEGERPDRAIDLLQRVDESHPRYLEAVALSAEVLCKKGYSDLAIERYRTVVKERRCDPLSVEHYYQLATLLADRGDLEEAEKHLGEVVAFKFGYKEVAARLEEVRRLRTLAKAEIAATPPPIAATAPAIAATAPPIAATAPPIAATPPPIAATPPPIAATPPPIAATPPPIATAALRAALRAPARAAAQSPAPDSLVTRMDGFDVLAATPLFSDLSLSEMKRFWEVCELRQVKRGDLIFEEGIEGSGLYVVREGAFNVIKSGEILVQLHAGEFFGEMSLIDQSERTSARIEAASDGELFFLGRNAFNRCLAANDGTALKMYRVFVGTTCARLRRLSEDFATLKVQAGSALDAPD